MVQSNLIGHWPLHEWSGDRANDLSGNDNHGTLNGGVTQGVAGRGGLTAYSFDGSDGYVNVGSGILPSSGAFSISGYFRADDTVSAREILATEGERLMIRVKTDDTLVGLWRDSGGSPTSIEEPVEVEEWKQFTLTYDGGFGKLYIDGELVGSANSGDRESFQDTLSIGYDSFNNAKYFDGSISDVRVYNRALSQSEIDYLYRAGSVDVATPPNASDPNAVARYAFDDRSDTSTALDEWGSNDGTINGATYSSDDVRDDSLSMSFDGTDDRVELQNIGLSSTQSFTISAWANPDQLSSDKGNSQAIFGRYDGADDIIQVYAGSANDEWHFGVGHVDNRLEVKADYTVQTEWQHIIAMFESSSSTVTLYKNSIKIGEESGSVDNFEDSDGPWIGNRSDNSIPFDGKIDDVRIYDRALSDYEVQQLYQYGTRGIDMRYEVVTR